MSHIAANIALEGISIAVMLIVMYALLSSGDKLGMLFPAAALLFFATILDMVAWLIEGNPAPGMRSLQILVVFLLYLVTAVYTVVFMLYLVGELRKRTEVPNWPIWCSMVMGGMFGVFVIVSQFFDLIYYIDGENVYHLGVLNWVDLAYSLVTVGLTMAVVLRYRKGLNRKELFTFLCYIALPGLGMALQLAYPDYMFYYPSAMLAMLIVFVNIQSVQGERLKRQELELENQRLTMLLSQIKPHFLYNSLTAIGQLCVEEPQRAQKAISDFSHYLRGNMDALNQPDTIPFAKELEHVEQYLNLEMMRFEDRLEVVYDIEEADFELPPLTLQPLVENAVKYGATAQNGGGRVTIRSARRDNQILITVEDNGNGFDPAEPLPVDGRSHTGIQSVETRLRSICSGTVTVQSAPNRGTTVELRIPIQ